MSIRNVTQRTALAAAYASAAPFGCLFTADPGTANAATGEVSGGSPAYARKNLGWTAASGGSTSGGATFDVPSGTIVTFAGVAASGTAGAADVRDSGSVPSQQFSSQGQYAISTSYTQS